MTETTLEAHNIKGGILSEFANSITLKAGVTALAGPSGAGKTSLAKLLCGITPLNSGSISLNGILLADGNNRPVAPHQWKAGYLPQSPSLFPHLTVIQNMAIGLQNKDDAHCLRLSERLALTDHLNKKPHQLSGGQARRAALARAIAHTPKLLILDEPFAGLDPRSADLVSDEIKGFGQDHPVLLIGHEPRLLLATAQNGYLVQSGRIIGHAPMAGLLDSPEAIALFGRPQGGVTLPGTIFSIKDDELTLEVAGQHLSMAASGLPIRTIPQIGQNYPIQILSSDVAISRQKIEGISMRNQIECQIDRLDHHDHIILVQMTLAQSNIKLRSLITSQSAQALELQTGHVVTALIKAVRIAPLAA